MQWKLIPTGSREIIKNIATSSKANVQPETAELLATLLSQRNISSPEEASTFFKPSLADLHSPFLMKNMDLALQRLIEAKENREKILVYGDYDVDGTTSVSMMTLFLEKHGFDYEYYIPDRYKEGYGLSYQGVDFADKNACSLLITLDCGIKANDKIAYAKQKNIKTIVCDHHKPSENPPEAIILNPQQVNCEYPNKNLSGCAVGFKLIQAFLETNETEDEIENYLDFVAVSIACDIVKITGENRILLGEGLKKFRLKPNIGFSNLKKLTKTQREWNVSDLVFFIGPRINAAGRLESAETAVEVLRGEYSPEELEKLNTARKGIEEKITNEALKMIEESEDSQRKRTTVLWNENWHKGTIGIVASRLIETHFKPTILFTKTEDNLWVASARSVSTFDIYAALENCSEFIYQFGGHKYAAGLTVKGENLEKFAEAFEKEVANSITGEQKIPTLRISQELDLENLDVKLIDFQDKMAPFGPGNMRPVYYNRNLKIEQFTLLKGEHLKMKLRAGNQVFGAIGFYMKEKFALVEQKNCAFAFQLRYNVWNNQKNVELLVKDIQVRDYQILT